MITEFSFYRSSICNVIIFQFFWKGESSSVYIFFQTDLKCRFFKVGNRLDLKNNTKNITLEFHRKYPQLYTCKLYDLPYRNNMSDNKLWAGPIFSPTHQDRSYPSGLNLVTVQSRISINSQFDNLNLLHLYVHGKQKDLVCRLEWLMNIFILMQKLIWYHIQNINLIKLLLSNNLTHV